MKLVVLNRQWIFKAIVGFSVVLLLIMLLYLYCNHTEKMVMGGQFSWQLAKSDSSEYDGSRFDVERYFRPSKLPVLNNKDIRSDFFHDFWSKEPSEIVLPDYLLKTPEDSIINYFSILRHAANFQEGKGGGCGTVGNQKIPYPIAYNFLSSLYQEKLNYNQYLKSFENIQHINLIKSKRIATDDEHPDSLKYFVEIETIEGSEKNATYFAYYYGFLYIIKEGNQFKISDLLYYGEDFLCAAYHGWHHIAEAVVDVKYDHWCSLVKERYPTKKDGFVKRIYFKGTDGNDYLIVFFQLTNDTDIEIAQYKKAENGKWKPIKLDPEKCLKKKSISSQERVTMI